MASVAHDMGKVITRLSDILPGKQYYFRNIASGTLLTISPDLKVGDYQAIVGRKNQDLAYQKWTIEVTKGDRVQYSFRSNFQQEYIGLVGEGIVQGQNVLATEENYSWDIIDGPLNGQGQVTSFRIISSDLGYAVTLQDNGSVQEDTIVDVQDDYQYDNQIWIIIEVGSPTPSQPSFPVPGILYRLWNVRSQTALTISSSDEDIYGGYSAVIVESRSSKVVAPQWYFAYNGNRDQQATWSIYSISLSGNRLYLSPSTDEILHSSGYRLLVATESEYNWNLHKWPEISVFGQSYGIVEIGSGYAAALNGSNWTRNIYLQPESQEFTDTQQWVISENVC